MRFIEWLVESDWDETSSESDDRVRIQLKGLFHQSLNMYEQIHKITAPHKAARHVGIGSGVVHWKPEIGEVRIPYYYDHRNDYSVKDEPSVIIVDTTRLTKDQTKQIYRIAGKMREVYKEQMKLKGWKDPLDAL